MFAFTCVVLKGPLPRIFFRFLPPFPTVRSRALAGREGYQFFSGFSRPFPPEVSRKFLGLPFLFFITSSGV